MVPTQYILKNKIKTERLFINTKTIGINYDKSTPFPSPTSSCSSSLSSSFDRIKCQIIRKGLNSPKINNFIEIKSPAASFLSNFSLPKEIINEEIGDEIDEYVIDKIIGFGGFSTVREGYHILTGEKVAIKIIKKSNQVEKELFIWKSLQHENILKLKKILETDHMLFIVSDYCNNGSLLNQLNIQHHFNESKAKELFIQLSNAILYLHQEMKICHKDLKLENVLILDDKIKLCDFGLSVYQDPNYLLSSPIDNGGSLPYVSPEQIQSSQSIPLPSTDIWSLGVILYTIVTGQLPFYDDFDLRLKQKILNLDYQLPTHLSTELKDLIQNCLQKDPTKRYTIQQVLQSSWCKSI